MPFSRRKPAAPVKGAHPPRVLPTVWANWNPAPDGETVQMLRRYFERMDLFRADAPRVGEPPNSSAIANELAVLMYNVYGAATVERFRESTGAE